MRHRYDVAIVGGGIVGCMVARELARCKLDVVVVERAADVGEGSSKANSGLIHTGFHARGGSLKGLSTVEGNAMYTDIARELDVPFERIGALYCAFGPNGMERVRQKHDRAFENGAGDLPIVSGDEARAMEPRLSRDVIAAMVAESTGIISPFALVTACAENAAANGVRFEFNAEVERVTHFGGSWNLNLSDGRRIDARFVVNTAGDQASTIDAQVRPEDLEIAPRRGQFYVFDKQGGFGAPDPIRHVLFQAQEDGEGGTLLCPTVDGNILAGPTSENVRDFVCNGTSARGLEHVRRVAEKIVPDIQLGRVITAFAGVRANIANVEKEKKDFVLRMSAHGFVSALGIKNPGMTCAPALARRMVVMLAEEGLRLEPDPAFNPLRQRRVPFLACSAAEQERLLAQDPSFGHVLCRCEKITEGDVRRELAGVLPPHGFEGMKHRLRVSMGRCQGGFCKPRVQAILDEVSVPGEFEARPCGREARTYRIHDMAGCDYVLGGQRQGFDPELAALEEVDVLVVGGGAGGIAAATAAAQCGASVLLVEREEFLGGVLPQCIHDGFGMYLYRENLTGPGYLQKWLGALDEAGVRWACASSVTSLEEAALDASCGSSYGRAPARRVVLEHDRITTSESLNGCVPGIKSEASQNLALCASGELEARPYEENSEADNGFQKVAKEPSFCHPGFQAQVVGLPFGGARTIRARSVIVASGCREITRGQLRIPGTRPEGVYTAGTAQYMVNIERRLPGNKVVILGGGDIGLIMARRMTLAGAEVRMVVAKEATGLVRNHRRCIEPFGIPTRYGWGVTSIHGHGTLKGVMVAPFNDDGTYDMARREYVRCNTLLISCGLVPERELFGGVEGVPGLFVTGNADHVHDLVDRVSVEGVRTGVEAARFAGASGTLDDELARIAELEINDLPIMQDRLGSR